MRLHRGNLMMPEEAGSTGTPSAGTAAEAPAAEAPAAAPVAEAPAPAAAPADDVSDQEGSDIDWAEESAPDEGDDGGEAPVKPAAEPAKAPVPAAKTEAAPAAAPAPVAPAAAPAPAATPAPAAPAEPAKPAAPVAETAEAKTARETAEKAEEEKMFNGLVDYYKIPDEMAARLPTEPENVLPIMAAKIHQAVVKGVQNMLAQQLPQYIHQSQRVMEAETKSKEAFYSAWPQLRTYEQQVLQAGQLYRSMNPGATADQAIKAIGEIVSMSLGIAAAPKPGGGNGSAAVVPAPAAPLAQGFVPAGGGSGSRAAAPPQDNNEFTRMAEELDTDT